MPQREEKEKARFEDVVAGRNAVAEVLRSGRELESIYVAKGEKKGSIVSLIAQAKRLGITVKESDTRKLDFYAGGTPHQGIVAILSATEYSSVEDILQAASQKGEAPFLLIADEVEDPHNLGAIIRTAECAGAHGLIIPKRRSAGLTAAVYKTSAGAASYLPVARVTNLAAVIDGLKKQGIWICGADMGGTAYTQLDYTVPLALVVGSEGNGIGRLVREKCDFIATLPMMGRINSLNASVAASVLMYEVLRQRRLAR